MRHRRLLTVAITLATGAILAVPAVSTSADQPGTSFRQTNLVTDDQARAQARFTDTSLKNPWGISSSQSSPMWVSDNNAGVTTLYRGDGSKVPLTVVIPPAAGGTQGSPTGTVFNSNSAEFRARRHREEHPPIGRVGRRDSFVRVGDHLGGRPGYTRGT